jgi:hypothetical protein
MFARLMEDKLSLCLVIPGPSSSNRSSLTTHSRHAWGNGTPTTYMATELIMSRSYSNQLRCVQYPVITGLVTSFPSEAGTSGRYCKTKKGHCAVWPTLGRSFYFSAGTSVSWTGISPPIPTPMCTEDPAKKTNFDRDFFLSWSVGGVRSCTVISRRHPIVKQPKVIVQVWPTLGRSFISRQGHRSVGTGMSPPIPTPMCTEVPAKKTKFDRDSFLTWSLPGCGGGG